MLRLIIRVDDASMAANVGGPVHSQFYTFDVYASRVQEVLSRSAGLVQAQLVGCEIISEDVEDDAS